MFIIEMIAWPGVGDRVYDEGVDQRQRLRPQQAMLRLLLEEYWHLRDALGRKKLVRLLDDDHHPR